MRKPYSMPKQFQRYTVTAALPYANGPLHIGHIAGAYISPDIYVRYQRLMGRDVLFVGGSDEHGAAITIQAKKEGCKPQEIIDKYHEINKKSFEEFGISFDMFHRTSAQLHHETSQGIFKDLYDKGVFNEEESEQYYDEEYDQFLADRYIVGTCPKCGNENAYGDQCENCGTALSPTELINPVSKLSGKLPILRKTKHWYLPLDKYEDWLRSWIVDGEGRTEEWKKNVAGQCKSWLDDGLKSRSITRDLDWGIKVPLPNAEGKVLYVWLDAPIGYISSTKQWAIENGKDWEPYWKDKNTKLLHFIGKDNIVFHCIIFPTILKAQGDYILPTNVPANEFLNLEGQKISTSRNWAIWLKDYLVDFPNKQDVLRYVLCANAPETKDNDFTWKDFQTRNNSELVGIFGNFINRALVLTQKYYEGVVPTLGALEVIDKDLIEEIAKFPDKISASIEQYRFREALGYVMDLARLGNKYLADTEPWKLIKTDEVRVKTIMNLGLQIAANLSIVAEPFLPFTSEKLRSMLRVENKSWNAAGSIELLAAGHLTNEPSLLFEKIEDTIVEEQIEKLKTSLESSKEPNTPMPQKEEIVFDDFTKMDIRVGTILEAEKIPKSKKLLKLLVDTGLDKRVVLSGIAEHYNAEEVIGRQVSILINLAPRKMMGHESHGMILMAEDANGKLAFIQPDKSVSNGGKVS